MARFVDPRTSAPFAYQLFCVKNAEEIYAGRRELRELAVHAIDDFSLEVELRSPTPFFLRLITQSFFAAVPRQVIAKIGSGWIEPGHIITSGPFTLRAWRRYENVSIVRNPRYYDRDLVALDEVTFCSADDETTTVNLYKAGAIAATTGANLPASLLPGLSQKKDFRVQPAFAAVVSAMNTRRPPFDRLLLRYALNMATNKTELAGFLAAGRIPALSLVPPMAGYTSPAKLPISIGGRTYDVLAFDPEGAKALMALAFGSAPLAFTYTYHFPNYTTVREMAQYRHFPSFSGLMFSSQRLPAVCVALYSIARGRL